LVHIFTVSRDKSVGIATGYRLDSRLSIPDKKKIFIFSTTSRPVLGSTEPPDQWVPVALSLGVKRPGRKFDDSPPSSTDIKGGGAIPPLHNNTLMAWCLINKA
jgi:hypothetical protein